MSRFRRNIRPHVDAELRAAAAAESGGDSQLAFRHLERAHILGQGSTLEHVRVHWLMLRWALRQGSRRELRGQLLRLTGAALLTALGFVPEGNTGGANVSPVTPMPIADELAELIRAARSG